MLYSNYFDTDRFQKLSVNVDQRVESEGKGRVGLVVDVVAPADDGMLVQIVTTCNHV